VGVHDPLSQDRAITYAEPPNPQRKTIFRFIRRSHSYCRDTLEIMMPGGGYCFAPTHALQDNSLPENVVAMY